MTASLDQLSAWVQEEQEILWSDLSEAINASVNGHWSMQAANIALRINEAARLVGPTPYGSAPWPLVAGGVYEAVYAAAGINPEMPDEAEWQRSDELMGERSGTRATERPRYAATVAAINSVRERAWISGGGE